jgi:acylphosphatase
MVRRRIVFYGRVQGVGFRWRARHAAALYGCTGWARNEWDGSVTMEIQGTKEAIDSVIAAVGNGSFIHVESTEEESVPPVDDEREFTTE